MPGYFEIGKITNTHGLKGELRVYPTTDEPERFSRLKEVDVRIKGHARTYEIESVRYHKQFVILKLSGINDATAAEALKTAVIVIPDKLALPLEKDQYFIRDLIGLTVFTEDGEELGELIRVLPTGANDVYVIKTNDKELLIPAIKQCILDVDIAAGKIIVHLLEGLRELP